MESKLILFMLPAIVLAEIRIELFGNIDPDVANIEAKYSGSDVSLISDREIRQFKITDNNLKYTSFQQFGRKPDYTYVNNPSFWGDLYQTNNWEPVTRTLMPENTKVVKVSATPQIVFQQIFENNGTVPVTYDVDISHMTEVTISSQWTNNSKLTVYTNIAHDFEIELLNSGGKMSLSFTSPWGADTEMKQTMNTGSTSSVQVPVAPGKSATAQVHGLTASFSVVTDYVAKLAGDVVAHYDVEYKGHKFWELPVTKAMSLAGLPDQVTAQEVMHITCFTHSKVVISDKVDSIKITEVVV